MHYAVVFAFLVDIAIDIDMKQILNDMHSTSVMMSGFQVN